MATKRTLTKEKPAELKMYVGPTIPALNLINNSVYSGIPTLAVDAVAEYPIFKALFINIEDYSEAGKSIRERKGLTWIAYNKVIEIKSKGGF